MVEGRFNAPQQVALRSRIVLLASEGQPDQQISKALKIQRGTVALWRRRALTQGIGCVWEIAPGRGRKPRFKSREVAGIVKATLHTKPQGATQGIRGLCCTSFPQVPVGLIWSSVGLLS
jgi:hypothetical protein